MLALNKNSLLRINHPTITKLLIYADDLFSMEYLTIICNYLNTIKQRYGLLYFSDKTFKVVVSMLY